MSIARAAWTTAALVATPTIARADDAPPVADPRVPALEQRVKELEAAVTKLEAAQSTTTEGAVKTPTRASLTLGGWVEAFYQWNFNQPQNQITNYRGFDDRHDMFSVQNVALDAVGKLDRVAAHVAIQFGTTSQTYYASEPVWRATRGAPASGPDVWKFIQQANVAYDAPIGRGLLLEAGIFLSPIGPESLPVKDQWNWSRSDLFFGLPFYHTGARATYPFSERLSACFAVYDGWNSVVDDNPQASVSGQLTYTVPDRLSYSLLYFGGVERPTGAPEGAPWRNLFDTWLQYSPTRRVSTMFHADAGFEPNTFGTSGWAAGAVYLRVQPLSWLYLAARGDAFYEWIASNALGAAAPLFWNGSHWVTSQTATIDVRPNDNMSVRLELRHDESQLPLYFAGPVAVDASGNWVANATSQNTITLGATAWF